MENQTQTLHQQAQNDTRKANILAISSNDNKQTESDFMLSINQLLIDNSLSINQEIQNANPLKS